MDKDENNVDSVIDLWDNMDRLTFYIPLKHVNGKGFKIVVGEDPEYEGMQMLRVFLCKEDLELYSRIYSQGQTYSSSANISSIEEYMSNNCSSQPGMRLSRCVLCSIDIKHVMREVETLWKFDDY